MNATRILGRTALSVAVAAVCAGVGIASATEPCGDFGECKALVEINASDGDIGFHFLMDGDNLIYGSLFNPKHRKIFVYWPKRELRRQTSTELFQESAEPPCSEEVAEEGDDVVTLVDFMHRWDAGTYYFFAVNSDYEWQFGRSDLSFDLPAAPAELELEIEEDDYEAGEYEYEISWEAGEDLGECSDGMEHLPTPPADVPVALWEIVLEVDIDAEDAETPEELAIASAKYVTRIPGTAEELEIEVPDDFVEALPENTPAKFEVGAIGFDDNATFSEEDEICLNDTDPEDLDNDGLNGCEFEV